MATTTAANVGLVQRDIKPENPQHLIDSSEWYTPPPLTEPAREAMGGFDLDPASCSAANAHIQAAAFFDAHQDGLSQPWEGRVFLNPPNPPRPWWDRLVHFHRERAVPEALFIAYSIEQLQQSQRWEASMLAFPVCIPDRRIAYLCTASDAVAKLKKRVIRRLERAVKTGGPVPVSPNSIGWTRGELRQLGKLEALNPLALVKGTQPSHASAIVGVGWDLAVFRKRYGHLGEVIGGIRRTVRNG